MSQTAVNRHSAGWRTRALLGVVAIGLALRALVVFWSVPLTPHHPDERILSFEAIGLWEGVTPREVGWPASTTRLALSGAHAVQFVAERGTAVWARRGNAGAALAEVARWIGDRFVDEAPIFLVARTVCIAIGLLQLVAMGWTATRLLTATGAVLAAAVCALAPLAVSHSQFVLADISGVLCATLAIGLIAGAGPPRVGAAGFLAGCAAASKFHFGLWLIPVLVVAWHNGHPGRRVNLLLTALVAFALAILLLVPWFWLNPILALKELGGVVGVKVGSGARPFEWPVHFVTLTSGLGVLAWVPLLLRPRALTRQAGVLGRTILWTTLAGFAILVTSQIVFDRYSLVVLPGVALLAGAACAELCELPAVRWRTISRGLVAALALITLTETLVSQRRVGEAAVDWDVQQWILHHVAYDRRVALHDEFTQYLPQRADQLAACATDISTRQAYRDKLRVNGITGTGELEPVRSAILNDEYFTAYWCRREMAVSSGGYVLRPYHDGDRFHTLTTSEAIARLAIPADRPEAIDVLVLAYALPAGQTPAAVFERRAGRRVIYARPEVVSRQ